MDRESSSSSARTFRSANSGFDTVPEEMLQENDAERGESEEGDDDDIEETEER